MEIYADILFFNNFVTDLILVYFTARIMSVPIKHKRAFLSAAAGAAAGVVFFVFDFSRGASFVFSLLCGFLITFCAFYPCGGGELLKRTLVLYPSSALFCGIMYADMLLFGGGVVKNGVFYTSSMRVSIAAILTYAASSVCAARFKRRCAGRLSGIWLEYKGKRIFADGFYDTGNCLTDPISKKPVMLIEEPLLRKLVCEQCRADNISEWAESERLRLIPYKSVNGDGFFTGLVLDRVYIDGKCTEKAIAAVCEKKLKYPVILNTGM